MEILITLREIQMHPGKEEERDEFPWEMENAMKIRDGDYILSDEQVIKETMAILAGAKELMTFEDSDLLFSVRRGMYLSKEHTWAEAMIGDGDVIEVIHP